MLQQARGSDSGSESDGESEDEWEGFEEPIPVDHEAEYIDEDKYTTVTVEEMGTTRNDFQSNKEYSPTGDDVDHKTTSSSTEKSDKPAKPRQKANSEKKRKKKFRYESKAERKVTQRKERMSNRKHAKSRQDS
jgi:ribosomal RNA-processing protein 17